jgi:hypothetical protein
MSARLDDDLIKRGDSQQRRWALPSPARIMEVPGTLPKQKIGHPFNLGGPSTRAYLPSGSARAKKSLNWQYRFFSRRPLVAFRLPRNLWRAKLAHRSSETKQLQFTRLLYARRES